MDALEKKAQEVLIRSVNNKDFAISQIMVTCGPDFKLSNTLKTQLNAMWNLSFTLGRELGTYEGYKMSKDGQTLGQVAHVN